MRTSLSLVAITCIVSLSFGQPISGDVPVTGLSFVPDHTFSGASLAAWKKLGSATWSAREGTITGTVRPGATGGLLLLDRSFQDVGVNTLFRCSAGSEAGLVFRIEQGGGRLKGIMISIGGGEAVAYKVTFDSAGRELERQTLLPAGGMVRMAPAPKSEAGPSVRRGRTSGNRSRSPGPDNSPLTRPSNALRPGEWNHIEVILDMNILRSYINDGNGPGGYADEADGSYGPVGLYASGQGEVEFKAFRYKNLALRYTPKEETSARFEVQRISDMYYSWSSASADFNKDGFLDVVAGPHVYYGPDYTKFSEIFMSNAYSPSKEFTEVNCQYTFDFDGNGWPDVFVAPPFGRLYLNPEGALRRWDAHAVIPGNINSEVTVFTDMDGDKKPELIYGVRAGGGVLKYAKPDPADPTKPWKSYAISEPGYFMAHGIGVGDIDGDGLADVLNPYGWWAQPVTPDTLNAWVYHPEAFARYGHRSSGAGGSVMAVYDVNGDKLNDVVTSLNAHGFGLAWFEQKRDARGKISFVRHMIMDDYSTTNAGDVTFSELHGSTFADVDGDGITDFIVGKRYFSHIDTYLDPDPYGPAVLYWYRTVRNPRAPGGAEFIPELIHNRSGAGSDILATDLNKDGATDIVSSTNRGTFIFWNTRR